MKKTIILFALIAFLSSTTFATNSIFIKPVKNPVKASEVYLPVGKNGQLISLMDLSQIRVKDLENLTGRKMKLVDKINFMIGQRELKKSINSDGSFNKKKIEKYFSRADVTSGFHLGGFALGFLLSIIGVLIAYLIKDDKKQARVKWAWIGFAVSLVIILIAAVI